jgi:ligand-binding sensor domain-containing protein
MKWWHFHSLLILLLALSSGWSLAAQKYAYVQYHAGSGAPFSEATTMVQDTEGFIWVGSPTGLYRFDGRSFENFSNQTQSQHIYQLQAQEDRLVFVNDIGIYQVDDLATQPRVDLLLEGSINESGERPFYPNACTLGKDGAIWISQSNHSLGKFQRDTFDTYPFSTTSKAQGLALTTDTQGDLWALSPLDGLFSFDEKNNRFQQQATPSNGQTLLIHDDYLLVGGDALYIYTRQAEGLQLLRTLPLEDDVVTALQMDQRQRFLIGTKKGKLLLLPEVLGTPQTIYGANESHRVRELDFGTIHEIYVIPDSISQSGVLWICSSTGLWLLQQRLFESIINLPKNNPIAIAFGDDEKVWIPMNSLYEISPHDNEFYARQVAEELQVNAVTYDRKGNNWVSVSVPRVELMKMSAYKPTKRYYFGDRGESIFYLYTDSKNNIWFCQAPLDKPINGIGRINAREEVELYDERHGFKSRVLIVKESSRGEIYAGGIGVDSYLYRYDPQANRFTNLSPKLPFTPTQNFEVHDLTIDDQGIVWMASTDGLLRYDAEQVTLIRSGVLQQEEVRGVTHLPNGSIWVATAIRGLVFYEHNSATIVDEVAGMPSVINAYRCIDVDPQGRLWAGTPEGLVYARIATPTLPHSNPPRIQQVTLNHTTTFDLREQPLSVRENDQLQLEYTNLSFPADLVQYQYRLYPPEERELIQEEHLWQATSNQYSLVLNELNIGDYILEIRAHQAGGYQWSGPLQLPLTVFRPWYRQAWFLYPAIAILLLIIGYYLQFFVRRRIRQLQRILQFARKDLAEKQSELKQKIHELDAQQLALANAKSNIHMLELFVREIPHKASWNEIITAMGKAVDQSIDIEAFEICFLEADEIVHRGYSTQERGGYTFRSKPFNPKTSLASWAIANHTEVVISDYDEEHGMYIKRKQAYRFSSLIFVPFSLDNDQHAALCAYSTRKNQFNHDDVVMIRTLARFIVLSAQGQITKHA